MSSIESGHSKLFRTTTSVTCGSISLPAYTIGIFFYINGGRDAALLGIDVGSPYLYLGYKNSGTWKCRKI